MIIWGGPNGLVFGIRPKVVYSYGVVDVVKTNLLSRKLWRVV